MAGLSETGQFQLQHHLKTNILIFVNSNAFQVPLYPKKNSYYESYCSKMEQFGTAVALSY